MDLNDKLLAKIAEIFKAVEYGRITFFVNPEKRNIGYSIQQDGKLSLEDQLTEIKKSD